MCLNSFIEELSIIPEGNLFQRAMTLLVKKDCLKLVLTNFVSNLQVCPLVWFELIMNNFSINPLINLEKLDLVSSYSPIMKR